MKGGLMRVFSVLFILFFASCAPVNRGSRQEKRIDIISAETFHLEIGGEALSIQYFIDGASFNALAISREEATRIIDALESAGELYNSEVLYAKINLCFRTDLKSGGR